MARENGLVRKVTEAYMDKRQNEVSGFEAGVAC